VDGVDTSEYRCIHVIGALAAGGAERFVVDLVRELHARGRNVELLILSNRRDEAGEEMARRLGAEGIVFEAGPTARVHFRTILWYICALRSRSDSIVHLHTTNTELIHYLSSVVVGDRFRIVRTIHNTVLPETGLSALAFRRLPAEVSIACGNTPLERYASALSGRVQAISNGVRFDWPIRGGVPSQRARELLKLDPSTLEFLSVARMTGASMAESQKAHDILIRAWKQSAVGDRATLHLLGDGELRPELEALAEGDESILFHGVRKDVRTWLLAADVFVMASRWEGLPIAGIEAVGTGLPCLFSDIPSLREMNAPVMLMSPPGDSDGLARNIRTFADSHESPTNESVEAFRRQYGIERAAAEYDGVYRTLGERI
jgi:glycosyltransferase involved in cell wall biosynthesis